MQEQAEHMYSHSAVAHTSPSIENLVATQPVTPPEWSYPLRYADNSLFDAGADGDDEKAHIKTHHESPCNRRSTKASRRTLNTYDKSSSFLLSQHSKSFGLLSQSKLRKRTFDNLGFLTAYSSIETTTLTRQGNIITDPSTSKSEKRQKLAVATSHDLTTKRASVCKTAHKKSRKLSDPTYRAHSSSS
jgi:hypothetical protein